MSLLNMIRSRRDEKNVDVIDLSRRIASGETVDPDRIIEAVQAAGMDDKQFCDLVDLHDRRDKLKRVAEQGPAAKREVEVMEAEIKKINDEEIAAEQKFDERRRPFFVKLDAAKQRAENAWRANGDLFQSNLVPKHLSDAREAARQRMIAAGENRRPAERFLEQVEQEIRYAKSAVSDDENKLTRMSPEAGARILESADYRLSNAKAELEKLNAAHDEAKRAFDAANQACRDF